MVKKVLFYGLIVCLIVASLFVVTSMINNDENISDSTDENKNGGHGSYKVFDGNVFEVNHNIDEKSVKNYAKKLEEIHDLYFKDVNFYYSIIPDKGYYGAKEYGFDGLDYNKMQNILSDNLTSNIKYIDIFDKLKLTDYYKTDNHWRQECLGNVVNVLGQNLDFESEFNIEDYESKILYPFYGIYSKEYKDIIKPEELRYLTNRTIEDAVVNNIEKSEVEVVYDISEFKNKDLQYNIYLSGATPITTITNNNQSSKKEIIIFRDSFGSSIAPLLIEHYSKITLIDLRYVRSTYLPEIVEMDGAKDVLFLSSGLIVNNSYMLK